MAIVTVLIQLYSGIDYHYGLALGLGDSRTVDRIRMSFALFFVHDTPLSFNELSSSSPSPTLYLYLPYPLQLSLCLSLFYLSSQHLTTSNILYFTSLCYFLSLFPVRHQKVSSTRQNVFIVHCYELRTGFNTWKALSVIECIT